MKNPIKTFGPNEAGRDFVVGDLHGAVSLLDKFMEHIAFDKEKDRMFSVGDLVDRGADSLKTLELLKEPWFHAVLANHEQMMLEAFNGGKMGQYWLQNGGLWGYSVLMEIKNLGSGDILSLSDESQRMIGGLALVEDLPFLITVNHKSGKKFHIIHAELPQGCKVDDALLADPEELLKIATRQTEEGDFFLWGRQLYYSFSRRDLSNAKKMWRTLIYMVAKDGSYFNPNLSHIISGHSIVQKPLTLLGQTNIDTCAFAAESNLGSDTWHALTVLELDTWTFHQTRVSGVTVVEPVEINSTDIANASNDNSTQEGSEC